MLPTIDQRLAAELGVKPSQAVAAVGLLDEGATVPFIARYRNGATGELDDIQLRLLEEHLGYLRELEERRIAVLNSIGEQGKQTPALKAALGGSTAAASARLARHWSRTSGKALRLFAARRRAASADFCDPAQAAAP